MKSMAAKKFIHKYKKIYISRNSRHVNCDNDDEDYDDNDDHDVDKIV